MSKVQFNLLPDVKLDYIKSQRTRNLVTGVAVLVAAITLAIFILLLFTVDVLQKKQLSDANKKITADTQTLKNISKLPQVITVQNQLQTLVGLHQGKHVISRIFTYLPSVTPTNVHVGSVNLDFTQNAMTVSGTAESHKAINTFIDTLKFTKYKVGDQGGETTAFSSVVETNFSLTPNNASYTLTVQFDPQLFSNSLPSTPQLVVPKLTTTRSVLDDPSNPLFNGQTGNTKRQPPGVQ